MNLEKGNQQFSSQAALLIGTLLPLLETLRRGIGYWTVDFSTMFEDYVAGALLLIGWWASTRLKSWSRQFLLLAWAYTSGMMGPSFWGHLEDTLRGNANEPNSYVVVLFKSIIWTICVVATVLSFRRLTNINSDSSS